MALDLDQPLARLPDPLPVPRVARPFDIELAPPGSKSITNRAYLLAALAHGRSRIARPLRSDDCDRLLAALETLGAGVRRVGDDVEIDGVGGRFPRGGAVDLGDGGTPTRFMLAAACLAAAPVTIDGSPRMRERPVAEGVEILRALGADVAYAEAEGRLPVRVTPSARFVGGAVDVGRTASSQFISALLLVAPCLRDGATVRFVEPPTSRSYLDLTVGMLAQLGLAPASAGAAGDAVRVPPRSAGIPPFDLRIEPDASSALYWAAAAAAVPGSRVRVPDLDLDGVQPDARAIRALRALGAAPTAERVHGAPCAVFAGGLARGGALDAELWPDGALAVAALAALGPAPLALSGLRTLRVKETDRIAALACELRRVGCTVEADDDGLRIDPATRHDDPVTIETYDDHRMAMAFAVLGLARGGVSIRDPGCVRKSYPGFWADLGRVIRAAGGAS